MSREKVAHVTSEFTRSNSDTEILLSIRRIACDSPSAKSVLSRMDGS